MTFAAPFPRRAAKGLVAACACVLAACGSPDATAPQIVPASPSSVAPLNESLTHAIEAAESILKLTPNDPDALLAAALAAEHLGRRDDAVRYYSKLQSVTRESEYLRKLAEIQKLSSAPDAARAASQFFEQGGSDDELRMWLIREKVRAGDAVAAYRLTEGMSMPQSAADREFLRDVCLRFSQSAPQSSVEALAALRRSGSFAPLPVALADTAALALLAVDDARAALAIYKSRADAPPIILAKIADQMNDPNEALAQRIKYFSAGGDNPAELIVLLNALGRASPAREVAERAWRSPSLDSRSRLAVARTLADLLRRAIPSDTDAEIRFLEQTRELGEPVFLERLAELQQSIGKAREALATLRSRYPQGIPDNKADAYVSQAISAGEIDEAIRAVSRPPVTAFSPTTRRRVADLLRSLADADLKAGQVARARDRARLSDRFTPDAHTALILAYAALAESDTPDAMARLSTELKVMPSDPRLNYLAGKILFSLRRFDDARPHLQMAHDGRHPEPDLPLILGEIYDRAGSPMAYPLLNEYAAAHPAGLSLDMLDMLGRSALKSGQYSDAVKWLEQRIALRESESMSARLLEAAVAQGSRPKALGLARALTVKYPSSRPILEAASAVFEFSTDSEALLKTLESLSAIEADNEKKNAIQRRLLDVKLKMGRMAEADGLLTALLARSPDDPRLLASAWTIRKGTAAAEPILRRLAQIRAPGDPIQIIRAQQLMDGRDFSGALAVLREYLAIKKNDPDAIEALAGTYQKLGQLDRAADAYRELMKVRPDDAPRSWLLGYIYDQAVASMAAGKSLEGAESMYNEAKRLLGADRRHKDLYEVFGKVFGRHPSARSLAIESYRRELAGATERSVKIRIGEILGKWYVEDGQLATAKEMFALSQSAGNTSASFLRAYAALLARIGESAAASEKYRTVLKQSPFDREANLYLAHRAVESKNIDEAVKSLEALKAASPDDSAALDALARAYVVSRRYAEAADIWGRLVSASSSPGLRLPYADALYMAGRHRTALHEYRSLDAVGVLAAEQLRRLAELEQSHGKWASSEEIILRLLRMGGTPRDRAAMADVLRRAGRMAVLRGNADGAARAAERILSLNANDPSAFVLMGRAKLIDGKIPAAVESFSRAAALAPKDPAPLLGMADVEIKQKRWVAAIDFARKAIALDPSDPQAYSVLGHAHQKQGNVKEAYEALKSSLLHSKNRAQAHVRMGDLFLQHGKYNVAIEQYRQALAIDPKNAVAHYRNAIALHRLGFSENAMKDLLAAIELDPRGVGGEATVLLSELFAAHGDNAKARELLESAAASPSAPPAAIFHLGEMARRSGDNEKSVRLFRDALAASADPSFKYDVLNALGLALADMDRQDDAEKTFSQAASLRPAAPTAFLNLSLLRRSRKNFLGSVDAARKAILTAPADPEGYKLLGIIYYEAGWPKESLSAFRKSLQLKPDQPEIVGIVRSIESGGDEEAAE